MDVSKFGNKTIWVFADKLQKPIVVEFVEATKQADKNGKEFPVLKCVGTTGEYIGDVFISLYRCVLGQKLLAKFGTDTKKWGTPFLKLSAIADNKVYVELDE